MRNRLPHDPLDFDAVHLTYRLAGSIPQNEVDRIVNWRRRQLEALEAELLQVPPGPHDSIKSILLNRINKGYERRLDEALHVSKRGPFYLSDSKIARLVLDSWRFLTDQGDVFVYGVCVMGNHVHVILRAGTSLSLPDSLGGIVGRHKSHTGRLSNQLLNRTGSAFWAADYFDRRVRRGSFTRAMWYVLQNPVAAGLVTNWKNWPHTYVHPSVEEMFTGVIRQVKGSV